MSGEGVATASRAVAAARGDRDYRFISPIAWLTACPTCEDGPMKRTYQPRSEVAGSNSEAIASASTPVSSLARSAICRTIFARLSSFILSAPADHAAMKAAANVCSVKGAIGRIAEVATRDPRRSLLDCLTGLRDGARENTIERGLKFYHASLHLSGAKRQLAGCDPFVSEPS